MRLLTNQKRILELSLAFRHVSLLFRFILYDDDDSGCLKIGSWLFGGNWRSCFQDHQLITLF